MANIHRNLSNFPAKAIRDKGYGMTYEVVMCLRCPKGNSAFVTTAWIDDVKTGEMRLITAYVDL